MIVRISGTGQYDVPDSQVSRMHDLDATITAAVHAGDEVAFHRDLHELIRFIKENGAELGNETLVPSKVIVPPEDITLDEAKQFFHDDSLLEPVEA